VKRSEQKKEEIKRAIKRIQMGKKTWTATDKSKNTKENLPTIKILAERKITMIELDVDMNDEAKKILVSIGTDKILKDEKTIINYGFTQALKSGIKLVKKLK
jgi:hypothetical protein